MLLHRRRLLAALPAGLAVSACDGLARSPTMKSIVQSGEQASYRWQRLVGRDGLAREFAASDISPVFKVNGTRRPTNPEWQALEATGFAGWRLGVTGLVQRELSLSIADLQRLPQRTQITRHDCVEGWSAIGEWTGPQLSVLLDAAKVREEARFIVFRCADVLYGQPYYESIDMVEAYHPQTIIAHALNGEPLPEKNGAPLRARIERQLGYKHAKYLTAIEAVASLDGIGQGKGGFWEDLAGYQWYAGI